MNVPSQEEQAKHLEESLQFIRQQESLMRKCLDSRGKLLDATKHASTFLGELRTSSLSPKQYYELYIACFDALSYLGSYLKEDHQNHHLADIYELVQYAGNIVPRLYLMITVGTVYMSIPGAPVKEIMKDMMEMCRGVQHPIRGLFLRYYLSQGARDYLPVGTGDGPGGNLQDSVQFIITNFIEMNKLWVRLQHQGHSREREKRIKERQELQILVGSNLVRLSQLEGIDKAEYRERILPAILEQVVQCRDVLAQEYLLDVICQVFPDEFHLHTLDLFLNATNQLNPQVSVKRIVLSMINRLADYYATRKEQNEPAETDKALADGVEKLSVDEKKGKEAVSDKTETTTDAENEATDKSEDSTEEDLFKLFFQHVQQMVQVRPDIPGEDISGIMVGISRLSLNCYPDKKDNIDQVLEFEFKRETNGGEQSIFELLKLLIDFYPSGPLTILKLSNYVTLLKAQPEVTQKKIAGIILNTLLEESTAIETIEEAEGVFGLLEVVIREGTIQDNSLPGGNSFTEEARDLSGTLLDDQSSLSKVVHLLQNSDTDVLAKLLAVSKKALANGGTKVRYTYPSIVTASLKLVRRYFRVNEEARITSTFKFCHRVIEDIYKTNLGNSADLVFRLYVNAASVADQVKAEEIGYEYFAQAFTVYEESISDSRSQYQALAVIAGTLQSTRNFSKDNYDNLVSKCALYGSKLLKKPDQCRLVYLASHLWWATEIPALGEDESTEQDLFRDSKRVLECLQRALRVADGCMDIAVSVELFVEILNRYLYFLDRGNAEVTIKYINGLIDLINTNLTNNTDDSISDSPRKHFERTLAYINERKAEDDRWAEIVTSS